MKELKVRVLTSLLLTVVVVFISCTTEIEPDEKNHAATTENTNSAKPSDDSLAYNPTWTFYSHGKSPHDYTLIFPQDIVNRLEIIMTADTWNKIRANMKSIYGFDFGQKPAGGKGSVSVEPAYVEVQLNFNGKIWKNVGYRLKGNSSLSQAWGEGNYKLPFRLNFDKFEDTYPAIRNQHFYGFKECSFSPGMKDQSLQREKITPDIFRMAGVPAAQTAFYRVYTDFGNGLKYCGVYTAVEIPEDNMVKNQFGEEKGNIYKPESRLAAFIQSEFEKKNNETEGDYSDVKKFILALNNPTRTSDPAGWRSNLEAVFNVDHFIRYLAVNNAIVNWDSYGNMAHNYYLYNHSREKLTWIPWDHNEAMTGNPGISVNTSVPSSGGGSGQKGISLSMNEITAEWPLIKYIASDEVYFARYKSYLKWFIDSVFTTGKIIGMLERNHNLISGWAVGAEGEVQGYTYLSGNASFTNALTELRNHVANRRNLISGYVH